MLKTELLKNNEPGWLLNRKEGALRLFNNLQMPIFSYGLNINLNIDINLDKLNTKNIGKSNLKIINKNKDVIIEDFNNAIKNNGNLLKKKLSSLVNPDDKFTSFHYSNLNNLTFVHVPKKVIAKHPIEIASEMDSDILFDHLIILMEDNSELTLIEDSVSDNNSLYRSKIVEIFTGENSKMNYGNVQLLDKNTTNFTIERAVLGKNSSINWLDCCFGSKTTISEVTTLLEGKNSRTNNHGIFFGDEMQQFDLVANSIHKAKNTFSDILTKGTLTGSSKCLYRGLVKIHQNAPGSNGYQKQDTLLLSKDATADSIPNLEIDNNEVRCAHGATIGRIDKEKMFYLQSRGLNQEQATKEYVKGFFEPLIQKIRIERLKDNMHKLIEKRMK